VRQTGTAYLQYRDAKHMGTATQNGKTVLVVEDDCDPRQALALILRAEGSTVAQAADGEEAMAGPSHSPTSSI
jgi:DNA-binding NtrC family response regulator